MDNFITGSLKNIDLFTNHNNFEFIEHDVSEYVQIDGDLDYILHFASPASPMRLFKNTYPNFKSRFFRNSQSY